MFCVIFHHTDPRKFKIQPEKPLLYNKNWSTTFKTNILVSLYLVDGFCGAENDERKTSRPASVGVCLDVDALNLTVFTEVFPQLLCGGGGKGG